MSSSNKRLRTLCFFSRSPASWLVDSEVFSGTEFKLSSGGGVLDPSRVLSVVSLGVIDELSI
uniref:Uncharacterized protein n=1 Tax=Arundo donax TaxID=35708 RepID=A0A0A8YJ40_ARUDO